MRLTLERPRIWIFWEDESQPSHIKADEVRRDGRVFYTALCGQTFEGWIKGGPVLLWRVNDFKLPSDCEDCVFIVEDEEQQCLLEPQGDARFVNGEFVKVGDGM